MIKMKEGDEVDFKVLNGKDNVLQLDLELEDGTVVRVVNSVFRVTYMGQQTAPGGTSIPMYNIQSQIAVLPLRFRSQLTLNKE